MKWINLIVGIFSLAVSFYSLLWLDGVYRVLMGGILMFLIGMDNLDVAIKRDDK